MSGILLLKELVKISFHVYLLLRLMKTVAENEVRGVFFFDHVSDVFIFQ